MSKKIIGITVGTQLPKPNFKQTDPTKGDYIRNKPDFDGLKARVTDVEEALEGKQPLGDYALKEDLNVYVQDDEPVDAPDGTVWVDTDELGGNTGGAGVDEVARQQIAELTKEIAKLPTGGSGGNADWNASESEAGYVKNRTHWVDRPYEPIVVTPESVGAEGVDTIDISVLLGYPAGSVVLYKIGDHILTVEDSGASQVYIMNVDGTECSGPVTVKEVDGMPGFYNAKCYVYANGIYNNENAEVFSVAISGDFTAEFGINIPSTGTYIMKYDPSVASFEINADTYHTIDKRYLPDSYATKAYVDNLITGAIGGSY